MWRKALDSATDAGLPGLSVDSSLQLAYSAGLTAVLTLLLVHGLKPTSGPGHHEIAFDAAAGLGYAGTEELVPDSMEIRSLRAGSVYDPVLATEEDRGHALAWVRSLLPAVRAALLARDPALAPLLEERSN